MPASAAAPSVALLSTPIDARTTLAGERGDEVPCVDLHFFSGLSATCLEVLNTVVATGLDEYSQKKRANLLIKEKVSQLRGA
jgi:hypothetical protein